MHSKHRGTNKIYLPKSKAKPNKIYETELFWGIPNNVNQIKTVFQKQNKTKAY